jgi:hypothetical protein
MADLVGEDAVAVDLRSGKTSSGSESAMALAFFSDLDSVFPDTVYPDKVLLADEVRLPYWDSVYPDSVHPDSVFLDKVLLADGVRLPARLPNPYQ